MSKRAAAKAAAKEKELNAPTVPKHVQVIQEILAASGVNSYEPRVVNQLLEFTYRYVSEVLENAKVYSEHASKNKVDVDDVRLAIQSKVNFSFTGPPPREFQMELAQARNANPLHSVSQRPGIRLPPERYCLSAVNYQVDIDENDYNAEGIPATEPPKTATSTTTNTATNAATNSSTGASSSTDKPAQTAAGKFKKPAPAAISVQVAANAVENAYNGSGQAPAGFTMGAIKRSRDFSNDDDDDYD